MKFNNFTPVLAAIVFLFATPVLGASVFFDTFDSGQSPMWGNERGGWYSHDGNYDARYPSISPSAVSLLSMNLTDFAVDVDVNNISDGGIWLRSNCANGSVSGVLLVTGGVGRFGDGLYWHIVHSDRRSQILNPSSPLFNQGDNVHVRIVVTGNTYSCYLNGSLTPCTTLNTDEFTSGNVGLYDCSNQTFDNLNVTTGVEVSPSVATKIESAWDPIMGTASENFRFTLVGRLTEIDSNNLWINDGSKQPIKVIAPGYSDLMTGDFVRATGMVDFEDDTPVLRADDLREHNYPVAHRLISGFVRTPEGVGVSGVYVCPDGGNGSYTDSSGHYSVRVLKGWSGNLTAQHDLYIFWPTTLQLGNVTADLTNQNFEATRMYTISGHVRTADGIPASNVCIDVHIMGSEWDDCHTNSEGYYSLRVPAHYCAYLFPSSDLYDLTPMYLYCPDVTTDLPNQDFVAAVRPTISGHVITADGNPVNDAQIWLGDRSYNTDSNGYYALHVWSGWSGALGASSASCTLTPQSRDYTSVITDIPNQDFIAKAKPIISGHIRTADGTPLKDAQLWADGVSYYTDSEGYYALHMSPGWSGSLYALSNNFYSFTPESRNYTNVTTDIPNQDFEAKTAPVISGHIRTSDGTPVSGLEIWWYDGCVYTDSDGYYALHVRKGWSGTLQFYSRIYTFTPESRYFTDVISDQSDQDFEAITKPIISGHVRTADGMPVSYVNIYTDSDSYYTDSDGYYSLHVPTGWSGQMNVGSQELYAFNPVSREYTNVTDDIPDQDILAISELIISGYVRTANGIPIDDLSIDAYDSNVNGYNTYCRTDSRGYYIIHVPAGWDGTVNVWENSEYYCIPQTRNYINVTTNLSNQNFQAVNKPIISGYVKTSNGTPVENVELYLHSENDYYYYYERTDSNGYYSFAVPNDWNGTIDIESQDLYVFSPQSRDFRNITSDQPNSNFEAIVKPVISGHIRTADGAAVCAYLSNGINSYETDSDGYYSIPVQPGWSGAVTVQSHPLYVFTPESYNYANVTTDQPDQDYNATAKPTISGHIRAANGTAVEYVCIHTNDGWENYYTDSEGYYSIPVLSGWSGTVIVEPAYLYTFSPENRDYTNVIADITDQDYEAIARLAISGYIRTPSGTPVECAQINTSDGIQWADTNSSGYYSILVPTGWSGTVTVSNYLYTFNPESHDYVNVTANKQNQDFEAIPKPIISGYLRTMDGSPVSDAHINVSGIGEWNIDYSGYYSIIVPKGWSGTVTVSHALYEFNPKSYTYANVTTDLPNQNFQAKLKPTISGYVKTADGTPIGEVMLYIDNLDQSTQTDNNGYYSMAVPAGWSGKVHIWLHSLYTFSPECHEYTSVTSDQPNQDFKATISLPPPPSY
ncbi:MAG: hypothetical protein ABFD54_15315 [Armatimonadota bacterium]|nr:carboxypeptidase-like regulatory domain-containing protein [bacterium]